MTRAEKIDLIRSRPQLSVATLSADMGNQNAALQTLKENDVNLLHFDVMVFAQTASRFHLFRFPVKPK